ncbi:hypothetical protein HIM_03847 [Hirsutella minnesotensis 3608]|uniref:Uncharacterized protein n=1 Tax=Hirsutella minnesotensis 3608 TaxID=1043627 RepID=A0A0F7ZQB7_9HYPO|nr:hypothetical protein HIM_03847 [Hirsutella minnesotensis 3608]
MPEVRRGSARGHSDTALLPTGGNAPVRTTSGSGFMTVSSANDADPKANGLTSRAASDGQLPPEAKFPDPSTTTTSHDPQEQRPQRQRSQQRQRLSQHMSGPEPRRSLSYALRPRAEAYYDSRAATRAEYKRRAKTLEEYYDDNPQLLPQLPFTWHHGRRRWRLFLFAFFAFVDASAVPIALYYGMYYAGDVEGWIIFAVVTTIWGGPTYLEFAIRTFRLIKPERFYRPLGTESRWCFDLLNWTSVLTITAVTALFIVGSAPHIVWLRVLCMPAPAILYCLGGVLALVTLFHQMSWPAPFRISSTAKGERVLPGAYYFVEDVVAVNARAGRPYREALAARYKASPRFRRMLYMQSMFWSVPALILAAALTVVAVIPPVPPEAAYGVCWAVPFLWAILWGVITVSWCKKEMVRERLEWEADTGSAAKVSPSGAPESVQIEM